MSNVTNDAKRDQGKRTGKKRSGTGYKGNKCGKRDKTTEEMNRKRDEFTRGSRDASGNDPQWYAANPQLLNDCAKLSFNNPLGSIVELTPEGDETKTFNTYRRTIPGILCLHTAPTIGRVSTWTDPVNIAARNVYSYVRHANSGHANYDASDLMMYLLSADSVFSGIALMMRTYGLLRTYSVYNRYYPQAVIEACGFDFNSFMKNMANFRYYINQYIVKAGTLCIPANMTYFIRHVQLYGNVYLDEANDKAQTYLFSPRVLYRYDIGTSQDGPQLYPETLNLGAGAMDFDSFTNIMDSILNSILVNETMNIMAGDILKAYGSNNLWHVNTMPEDYIIAPVYNAEMLAQIHNATILNVGVNEIKSSWIIKQDLTEGRNRGCLVCKPQLDMDNTMSNSQTLFSRFIDSDIADPDPNFVMEATRLQCTGHTGTGESKVDLDGMGSEVVVTAHYVTYTYVSSTGEWKKEQYTISQAADPAALSVFSKCPILYKVDPLSAKSIIGMYGSLNNYTIIHHSTLKKLHSTALISQFTVPMMNTFSRG